MNGRLAVWMFFGAAALLVVMSRPTVMFRPSAAQLTGCFGHSGYAGQDDETFAKNQILNAKDRFQFWFAHLPDKERAEENKKNEWQIHIDWSIQDHGMVEPEIQKVWAQDLHIWSQCICPPTGEGRKTAMQIAIHDAKAGDCDTAALITVSTQLHNPEAIDTFHKTDSKLFCKYLKAK